MPSATRRPLAVVNSLWMLPRSPATSAKRYDGFGHGSSHTAKCRPPLSSPDVTRLPLPSSTGATSFGASRRSLKRAMTSGRSCAKVMRRKPSASHCVQNIPEERYRPDSCRFSSGLTGITSVETLKLLLPLRTFAGSVSFASSSTYSPSNSASPSKATEFSFRSSPLSDNSAESSAPSALSTSRTVCTRASPSSPSTTFMSTSRVKNGGAE
mmetsp:Transcript_84278/g.161104  ORF Transcript_84278/g.161104 Transcript_84278/m.161104 type:complete len:211 (+) Transcript_84278:2057-2689(+)